MKRNCLLLLLSCFLAIGCYFSLRLVLHDLKGPFTEFFDLKDGSSWIIDKRIWADREQFLIPRLDAATIDGTLFSKGDWGDFEVSVTVQNPFQCGVFFNYRDEQNYDYFFYDARNGRLEAVTLKDGRKVTQQIVPVDIQTPLWPLQLKTRQGRADIYFNETRLLRMTVTPSEGKIGFILTEINTRAPIRFRGLTVQGNMDGGFKSIQPSRTYQKEIPVSLALFYVLFLGLIMTFKKIFTFGRAKPAAVFSWRDILFSILAVITGGFVFARWGQILGRLDPAPFQDPVLWFYLSVSVLGYGLIYVVAWGYAKLFKVLSLPILFISLPLLLYLLCILNLITVKMDDRIFLWLCVAGLLLPVVIAVIRRRIKPRLAHLTEYPWSWMDLLLFLWAMNSVFYFLEGNFTFARVGEADELHFWFPAAQYLVKGGFLEAHTAYYDSGILYSLGIPFVWALPAKLMGVVFDQVIFLGPLFVIMALLIFLDNLRSNRWTFLFFFLGLVALTNNNNHWISILFYSFLYGDAFTAVYLLVILYEMRRLIVQSAVSGKEILGMSLAIGLLALSKSPVSYLSPILAGVFLLLLLPQIKERKGGMRIWLAALFFSVTPFLAWKVFCFITHISSFPIAILKETHFASSGWVMLKQVLYNVRLGFSSVAFLVGASLLFISTTFRGKELLLIMPIVVMAAGFLAYYGLIYTQGDDMSSIRYLLPIILALFYLGAVGFSRWIEGKR